MLTLLLTLGLVIAGGMLLLWLAGPPSSTLASWAWRVAQAAGVLFVASVALYEKPKSFYTNFVLLPSVALFLIGLLSAIIAIALGIVTAVRGDARRGLTAIGLALASTVTAWLVILWRAS
jgi:hypothetical protein